MESFGEALGNADRNIRLEGADVLTKNGFTLVPNMMLNSAKLSAGAKLTYVMLLKYAWENNRCFPGQKTLARDMGVSERHAHSSIKELEKIKYISVQRRGQGKSNIYTLHLRVDKRNSKT